MVARLHTTVLRLVISRFADLVFATGILYRPSGFHRFQNRDESPGNV
jgi:hypothetical protein